jgi:hypothetical protein
LGDPNIGVAQRLGKRVWWRGLPQFPQEVDVELLIVGLPSCCFGSYREWPRFGYLGGSHGAILGDSRDKRKIVHRGYQSTFPPAYRRYLVGVWYYKLRSPLKATFPGHPRGIGIRPQYKER